MAAIEQPKSGILGPTGHGVFDLGSEKNLGPAPLGDFGQIGAGTAADRDRGHLFGPGTGLEQPGRIQGLPDAGQKGPGREGLGAGADLAQAAGLRTTAT